MMTKQSIARSLLENQ